VSVIVNRVYDKAKDLVKDYGSKLVGRIVITEAIGIWPGGHAIVRKVKCKDDPNISMFVEIPGLRTDKNELFNEMGIFQWETITLTNLKKMPKTKKARGR
jgi:hypothetical protein